MLLGVLVISSVFAALSALVFSSSSPVSVTVSGEAVCLCCLSNETNLWLHNFAHSPPECPSNTPNSASVLYAGLSLEKRTSIMWSSYMVERHPCIYPTPIAKRGLSLTVDPLNSVTGLSKNARLLCRSMSIIFLINSNRRTYSCYLSYYNLTF